MTLCTVLFTVGSLAAIATPATAGAVPSVVINTPSQDAVFAYGSEWSAEVTITGFAPGSDVTWTVRDRSGNGANIGSSGTTTSSNPETIEIAIPTIRKDRFTIEVHAEDAETGTIESARRDFAIADVESPWAGPSTFYPLVRDGFRDVTRIHYRLGADSARTRVRVIHDGRTVATLLDRGQSSGRHDVNWNGRDRGGDLVAPGVYRVEILSRWPGSGTESIRSIQVEVATRMVTRRGSNSLGGRQTSSRRTRGNCYINKSYYPNGVQLDCWGGNFAQVTYDLRIPADAERVRWSVRGDVGCCDQGLIQRTARRIRPGLLRVTVKVTYWRAFTVNRVNVGWTRTVQQ